MFSSSRKFIVLFAVAIVMVTVMMQLPFDRFFGEFPVARRHDPSLPQVLVLGDSIAMGYVLHLQELLQSKANVYRVAKYEPQRLDQFFRGPLISPANGCSTKRALSRLDEWLGEQHWDVICFNFGLHDIANVVLALPTDSDNTSKGPDPSQYKENLEKIVQRLRRTGAKLVFGTTTPVSSNFGRYDNQDVTRFNEAAVDVMARYGVRVNDFYSFVFPGRAKMLLPGEIHLTPAGSLFLAEQAASAILSELGAVR